MRRVDEGNATRYSPCLFTLGLLSSCCALSFRSWMMMMMMMADMQFNLHILYQFFVCYEQAKLFFPDLKIFSHASLLVVCARWWLYCWVDLLWKWERFDNDNDDGRIEIWSFSIKLLSRRWKWKRRMKIWNPFLVLNSMLRGWGLVEIVLRLFHGADEERNRLQFNLFIHVTIWLSSPIGRNLLLVAKYFWCTYIFVGQIEEVFRLKWFTVSSSKVEFVVWLWPQSWQHVELSYVLQTKKPNFESCKKVSTLFYDLKFKTYNTWGF